MRHKTEVLSEIDGDHFSLKVIRSNGLNTPVSAHVLFTLDDPTPAHVQTDDARFDVMLSAGAIGFLPVGQFTTTSFEKRVLLTVITAQKALAPDALTPAVSAAQGKPVLNLHDAGLAALMAEAQRHALADVHFVGPYARSVVEAILNRLACVLELGDTRDTGLSQARLTRVLRAIETALPSRISTDELARVAGLSRSHFSRSFKVSVGETPQSYILGQRVSFARKQLEETALGLSEIAKQAGFSDQAHMTTVFRKRTGTTPDAYRRLNQRR